eukprot:TRINITY_DN3842_c0_g1_i4.p1 TRINITY_DN3842_c0_g1~~TRINITY_DN3842_c0_g1_i4.p1  ORF type:complete len:369 (-),score=137.36 TRINITY_DN3842_c0_g1_i4:895-2001(-)
MMDDGHSDEADANTADKAKTEKADSSPRKSTAPSITMSGLPGKDSKLSAPMPVKKATTASPSLLSLRASPLFMPSPVVRIRKGVTSSNTSSDLEQLEKKILGMRYLHEKQEISQRIQQEIGTFDEDLNTLRKAKFHLEADLKVADMKMLLLFQELSLLKDFEKQDTTLNETLKARRNEKAKFVAQAEELSEKLAPLVEEMTKTVQQVKELEDELSKLLVAPTATAFAEALTKTFERTPKRANKTAAAEQDLDEEKDLDADEFDDYDTEEEDDEPDALPAGCDPALLRRVLELREKKLALDETRLELRRQTDKLKSEIEATSKKVRVMDVSLAEAERNLQNYQLMKQQKLNELIVVVAQEYHKILQFDD